MVSELILFKNRVLVTDMQFGVVKTFGGVILPDDDGKSSGIKPRWAKVYKTGPDVIDIKVGDYVLLKHGRWTRKFKVEITEEGEKEIFMIDYPDAVLAVSKETPSVLQQISKNY